MRLDHVGRNDALYAPGVRAGVGSQDSTREGTPDEESVMRAGLYRHYKGGLYQLIGIGEHTETGERMVCYVSLAELPGCRLRIRPLEGPDGWSTPVPEWLHNGRRTQERFLWIGATL